MSLDHECNCNCCAEWGPKYEEARDLLVEAENIVGKMYSWLVVNSYNGELSYEVRTLGEMAERFNHKYYERFPIKQDNGEG